jgi:TfoX/Sxy family transcriptional regulator of competence genes
MEWKKAPIELVAFIKEKMKDVNCDYREMFGYPAYFINGNMFAGIHGDKLFLRLSDTDIEKIMKSHKEVSLFEPMPKRPMKGYIVIPKYLYLDNVLFKELLNESVKFVSSLPPKKKLIKQ